MFIPVRNQSRSMPLILRMTAHYPLILYHYLQHRPPNSHQPRTTSSQMNRQANSLTTSPSPLPKPHLRNLLIPSILQIPRFHHQFAPHPPHLLPLIAIHLRPQLHRQQLHLRFNLRDLDLVFFDGITLDATGAGGAAQWFGDGFGINDLGSAGYEGGVG